MSLVNVQDLIDAGVHFGHQARRWNPKMAPYIYGKRNRIHIINLQETIRGLHQACHFVRSLAATGAQILFLGTKRQIRAVVESEARRAGMPAVTERWIGGTLTNFNTVRERLTRLEELEGMEADGTMERHKKKAQSVLRREMRKINRNLEGIRDLHGLPGAIVVVDPRREDNCIREAARMNVPVVCLLDTDCNPDLADIVIPGNDDAMSSVQLLLGKLTDAIMEGRANIDEQALMAAQAQARDDIRARGVAGRREQPRGPRRGGGGGGGRGRGGPGRGGPGRGGGGGGGGGAGRSGGRFAGRADGHADSISFGKKEDGEGATKTAEAPPAAGGDAPKAEAPASAPDAPAVATPPPVEPPAGGGDDAGKPAGE